MHYYSLQLNLQGKSCLVVGAGKVGQRKLQTLLACGPKEVLILDPGLEHTKLPALLLTQGFHFEQRSPVLEDVLGRSLVFAASSERKINTQVAQWCAENSILCNVADAPMEGDFVVPATIHSDGISIALSTGGQSPALAKNLKANLQCWLDEQCPHKKLAPLLGRLRPMVLACGQTSEENAIIFRNIAGESGHELALALQNKDKQTCVLLLQSLLPAGLHGHIAELLHELV